MSGLPPFGGIFIVATEAVSEARKRVENELGSELARKASDEFCLAIAAARPPAVAGLEALGAAAPTPAAVIEFAPPPEEVQRLPERVEQVSTEAVGEEIRRTHEEAGLPEHALALQGDLPLRQASIKATRDDFLKTAAPVHDELERTAVTLGARPQAEGLAATPSAPSRAVEVCWLIRSIRTVADPRALSEVVAHPAVTRVDVPRRIEPDEMPDEVQVPEVQVPDFADVTMHDAARARAQSGATGAGVTVGVIDAEVALGHPALGDRVIHGRTSPASRSALPGRTAPPSPGSSAAGRRYPGSLPRSRSTATRSWR